MCRADPNVCGSLVPEEAVGVMRDCTTRRCPPDTGLVGGDEEELSLVAAGGAEEEEEEEGRYILRGIWRSGVPWA